MDNINELLGRIVDVQERLAGKETHTKTPANFSTYTPLHGSGGIFTAAGLERDILTAHMRPSGITSVLPKIPTVYQDPRFGTITGFTATSGSQPEFACQDAPTGYMKGCNLTARFGRIRFDTQTIDVDDVMLRLHRGDHTDLMLRGQLLGNTGMTPSGLNQSSVLNLVTMSEMVIAGVNMEREVNRQTWQGVTTVANEFPGLDVQIATGQVDADTNTACASLDSDVKEFAYNDVCGTTLDIVEYLSSMMWYLNDIATNTGLAPVQWVIVMRPGLWHELTACWPCQYNTNRCALSMADANASVSVDGTAMTAARDSMRSGMYIDIEGVRYPVITDTGIFEHNSTNNANLVPGQYASSIYAVPLTVQGGFPVTYMEHVDFRAAQADVNLLRGMEQFFWTDGGLYSWAYEQVKWCIKLSLKQESRIVLRAPHLAGRLDHVRYSPLQHERSPFPDDPYFKNGGISLNASAVLSAPYAVWSSRA